MTKYTHKISLTVTKPIVVAFQWFLQRQKEKHFVDMDFEKGWKTTHYKEISPSVSEQKQPEGDSMDPKPRFWA